jgi:hypothetical protein
MTDHGSAAVEAKRKGQSTRRKMLAGSIEAFFNDTG